MDTVGLNAQLLRELSYIADNESYIQKTIEFISRLARPMKVASVHGALYVEMLERLSDFQEYEQGWDGEDALPLNGKVVKNFKGVLQKCSDEQLKGWSIFPAANGTLLLQHQEKKAGINIGASGFSYYKTQDGVVNGESHLKFTPSAVLKTMKRL